MPLRRFAFLIVLLLNACQPTLAPVATLLPTPASQPSPTNRPTSQPTFTSYPTDAPLPSQTPATAAATLTPSPPPLPATLGLDPADWKNWQVLPIIPQRARQIYQLGQSLGNDPHAFSVFGDCQSEPDVFMGIYETDPALVAKLPSNLRATVAWFAGSFNRQSPTVQGGTTPGALMWPPSTPARFMRPRFNANYASTSPPL